MSLVLKRIKTILIFPTLFKGNGDLRNATNVALLGLCLNLCLNPEMPLKSKLIFQVEARDVGVAVTHRISRETSANYSRMSACDQMQNISFSLIHHSKR